MMQAMEDREGLSRPPPLGDTDLDALVAILRARAVALIPQRLLQLFFVLLLGHLLVHQYILVLLTRADRCALSKVEEGPKPPHAAGVHLYRYAAGGEKP